MARYSTSPTGFSLIKAFEGFRAEAAPLSNGGWVIGYGHTVSARKGTHINEKDASDLLTWDVTRLEAPLCDLIYAPLCQNQFDALMSLVFNIGLGHFKESTVLRRLNEGCPVDAAAGFDVWRRAELADQVIVVDALVRRRTAEKALFLATSGSNVVAPTPQLPPLCDKAMVRDHDIETPVKVIVDLHGQGDARFEPTRSEPITEPDDDAIAGLVSLDEAFEAEESAAEMVKDNQPETQQDATPSPVAEIAEKIAGRLETIATEADVEEDDTYQLLPTELIHGDIGTDGLETEETAPPLVDEEGILLEPYEPDAPSAKIHDTYDEGVASTLYAEPVYKQPDDIDPQTLLNDANALPESSEFQPAYDRGRGIFMLMGIIGIVMTLGGLWQIQNTISMTTNLDFLKGPGQALMGVLLVLISGYYLLRRLNR